MEGIMAKNATEKLLDDFHAVISDTEELMKSVSNESGGKTQALRAKIEENLKQAREYLHDFEGTVLDKSRVAARKTDEYVHENAWRTIGIAVGIGVLIGFLLRESGLGRSFRSWNIHQTYTSWARSHNWRASGAGIRRIERISQNRRGSNRLIAAVSARR